MFWESFERICRERGEAPSTVFRALGLSPTNITRIKNGGSVRNSTVKKIADYFGIAVSELLGEAPEPKKQDDDLTEYLEELKNRSELRMLFSLAKGATKEDVERAVAIIKALKDSNG